MQKLGPADRPLNLDGVALLAADVDSLPASMRCLAKLIGVENALRIVDRFGGGCLLIPKGRDGNPPAGREMKRLRDVIGDDAAAVLVGYFGGDRLEVPRCEVLRKRVWRRELLQEFECLAAKRNAGYGVRILARRYGCTERAVYYVVARARREQGSASR